MNLHNSPEILLYIYTYIYVTYNDFDGSFDELLSMKEEWQSISLPSQISPLSPFPFIIQVTVKLGF